MTNQFGIDLDTLEQAVLRWSGYGISPYPLRQDAAITDAYPSDAARLTALIYDLEEEFYRSDALATASSLPEIGATASARFRQLYPELPAGIAAAFAWCYTFDYR